MASKLKPLDVERETRPGKYPDGDGLYLVVASATSKNWSYRYWQDSKQRWLGLALQLPFCFEVRTLSDRLVSSAPE
jgi:hypothetical protein